MYWFTTISQIKNSHKTTKTKDELSPKLVTSPSKKKAKTYAKIQIVHLEDDEVKAHLNEISCGDDEEPQAETT
jgi:hypothetical protein